MIEEIRVMSRSQASSRISPTFSRSVALVSVSTTNMPAGRDRLEA
jgi:hypothetical protein